MRQRARRGRSGKNVFNRNSCRWWGFWGHMKGLVGFWSTSSKGLRRGRWCVKGSSALKRVCWGKVCQRWQNIIQIWLDWRRWWAWFSWKGHVCWHGKRIWRKRTSGNWRATRRLRIAGGGGKGTSPGYDRGTGVGGRTSGLRGRSECRNWRERFTAKRHNPPRRNQSRDGRRSCSSWRC